jgi:hypothetical protein
MRSMLLIALCATACGQQLVEFENDDLSVPDLSGTDIAHVDLANPDGGGQNGDGGEDLSFPFDLAGDMVAPCRALSLDGVHAVVTAASQPADNPNGAVTVEAWVYQTTQGPDEAVVAGHWGDPAQNTASYVLEIDATGHVVFMISPLGGSSTSSVTTTATVPLNTWTHVAGQFTPNVLTGATLDVFIDNGSRVTSNLGILVLSPAATSNVPLHIGRFSTATPIERPFTGFMHDVRYSSTARYPAAMAPPVRLLPDAQTIALYHFDEASGSNAADSSIHAVPGALLQNAMFATPPVCP